MSIQGLRERHSDAGLRPTIDGIEMVPAPTLVKENSTNRIVAANSAMAHLFGYSVARLQGLRLSELVQQQPGTLDRCPWEPTGGRALSYCESYQQANGATFIGRTLVQPHPDLPGLSVWTIVRTDEFAVRPTSVPDDRDPLTGLARRAGFTASVESHQRATDIGGLLFIDLNGFKRINDTFGHQYGDEVLRATARRLELATGPDDVVARWGGDEFVALVPGATTPPLLAMTAKRIVAGFEHPLDVTPMVALTVSVGGALLSQAPTLDRVMALADAAMYEAKKMHRTDGEFIRICV